MFGSFFRRRARQDAKAIKALQLLDAAIRTIHPDRFMDNADAMMLINGPLIITNGLLGRPDTERFFPLDYEALIQRFYDLADQAQLQNTMNVMMQEPVTHGLMRGVFHEYHLRHVLKAPHDALNLGKEVRSSTLTLLDFMNRVASRVASPMPGNDQWRIR
jgi:hypothetical protein